MSKVLKELNVLELKMELGNRELSRAGSKNELVLRLAEYLKLHNEDPDTFIFEIDEQKDVSKNVDVSSMMSILLAKFEEQQKNVLERFEEQRNEQKNDQKNVLERFEEQRKEQKNDLKNVLERFEEQKEQQKNVLERFEEQKEQQKNVLERVEEQQKNVLERLEAQHTEQKDLLEEQKNMIEGKLVNIEKNVSALDDRVEGVENKFFLLENRIDNKIETSVKEVVNRVDNKIETTVKEVENRVDNKIETIVKEVERIRNIKIRESSGEVLRKKEMQPPAFDGQTSWLIYKKQFEAASTTNGWDETDKYIALTLALKGPAAELLQTIPADKSGDFSSLVGALDKRFGNSHMKEVFKVQLNSRVQKRGETLQQLQADIERLVYLAYPDVGDEICQQFAVEAFVRAISDINLQRAVRTAGKRSLSETLAFALTMEAAEQASQGVHRLREITVEECSCRRTEVQRNQRNGPAKCWNCNKTGHLQRQCPLAPRRFACQHCGQRKTYPEQGNINTNVTSRNVSDQGNE